MDFDWITIHIDKINTLSEWTSLIFILSIVAGIVWYILSKKKADAIQKIDSNTIASYKNALESTRADLQGQLDHCSSQHKDSQEQINELKKENNQLKGRVDVLSTLPLEKITTTLDTMSSALLAHIQEDSKVQKNIDDKLESIMKGQK